MRARTRWALWVAGAVVALLGATPASAQLLGSPEPLPTKAGTYEPAEELEVVRPLSDAKKAVDGEAVRLYAREHRVSEQIARENLGKQVMVSNLSDRLDRATAHWFDNSRGVWVVAVQERNEGHVRERLDEVGLGGHAEIEIVEASREDLETVLVAVHGLLPDAATAIATDKAGIEIRVSDKLVPSARANVDRSVAEASAAAGDRVRIVQRVANHDEISPIPVQFACAHPFATG